MNNEKNKKIADNNLKRLKLLQISVGIGLIVGMLFSLNLWFPISRTFPRAPLFYEFPEKFVLFLEYFLTFALVISLGISNFLRKHRKIFSILSVIFLLLLIISDQMRLQPWVYQYLLLLIIFAFCRWQTEDDQPSTQTLGLVHLIIAGLYFWSGLQKLNYTFAHETLPILLEPLQNLFLINDMPLAFIGISLALIEICVGCGLLFSKSRHIAVLLAVILHATVLTLLIAKNHNSIVWVWNATLIALVIIAFWRSDNSVAKVVSKTNGWQNKFATIIVFASIALPSLSFFGFWDAYLSGALYSGNSEVGVIKINEDLYENLPVTAKETVFQPKTNDAKILPLFEWAINDLNVPVYPEKRVFKQIAQKVCQLTDKKEKILLIIKERPNILDGHYEVTQIKCKERPRLSIPSAGTPATRRQ